MKIVYCIPSTYNSGGMERVLAVKANYLADISGHDVTVITTTQCGRPHFYPFSEKVKHVDLGIDYESIKKMPFLQRVISRMRVKKTHYSRLESVLKDINPDVTISMFTHEMSFLPDIKAGGRKVLELHFSKYFRALDAKSNGTGLLYRIINQMLDYRDRQAIRRYDKFVVLSKRDSADWGDKYGNIVVISNPTTFIPSLNECTDYSVKKALAIGRLCPQKGFDILIDAWSGLPDDIKSEWFLDIVGSGPDENVLRQRINQAGLADRIRILPPTSDVVSLYKSHSIFCFPSRYEGFPLSLMEAMSYGLAVVACDCPCGPSELIEDGKTGLLVESEDFESFSTKLAQLAMHESMRRQMGLRAHEEVTTKFSETEIMKIWQELFTSIIDKR